MRKYRWGAAVVLAGLVAAAADTRADDKALDNKTIDKVVNTTLRDVINQGADLYNQGDTAGCYRLYEGAIQGVKPFLGHRPALQKAIDEAITRASRTPQQDRRAFELREVIDTIRKECKGDAPAVPEVKTLYDRLGGEKGITKVVDDFVAAAAADKKVDFTRGGKFKLDAAAIAHLKKTLVEQIGQAAGGPLKYTGKSMKEVHKGMAITDAEFDALAAHLKTALEKNSVKPEDVKAVLDVVNATRKDIVEPKVETKPTLYDRLGGEKGIAKVVDDFVAAAGPDPKVDVSRGGKYKLDEAAMKSLKKMLVEQIGQAAGGPQKYTGKSMKEVHKGMGITDAQFDAAAGHLKTALEKNGVKAEDVKVLMDVVAAMRKDIVEKP